MLRSLTCLWGGFLRPGIVRQQGMEEMREERMRQDWGWRKVWRDMESGSILRDGCMAGGYGVMECPWPVGG